MSDCPKCGAKVKKDDDFCPECGTKVNIKHEESPKPQKRSEKINLSLSKKWLIIPIIILIIILGFFAYKYIPRCGDGKITEGETCSSCSKDVTCATYETCQNAKCINFCGNGKCDSDENKCTCPKDCGTCSNDETCQNGKCVSFCGNNKCDSDENKCTCPKDCGTCSGNAGTCTEYYCNVDSCLTKAKDNCCGNDKCETGESCSSCTQDCGSCGYIVPGTTLKVIRTMPSRMQPGTLNVVFDINGVSIGNTFALEDEIPAGLTISSWDVVGSRETKSQIQTRVRGNKYSWAFTPTGASAQLSYTISSVPAGTHIFHAVWFDANGQSGDTATLIVS